MKNPSYIVKKLFRNEKESFMSLFMGVMAIFMLNSLFDNDSSKIISKKGLKVLADEEEMKKLNIFTHQV